jgi:hypothetical protein
MNGQAVGRLAALAAIAALALTACGSSGSQSPSAAAPAATPPASCHQQYETWKTGPALAAGKALITQLHHIQAASNVSDIPRLTRALKGAGRAAASAASYPMPHCADPHGYWGAIMTRIQAAGDNAGSAGGLGGLLLAMVPLKEIPALEAKLSAELQQTAHVGNPIG